MNEKNKQKEIFLAGQKTSFWEEIKKYMTISANPEKFLTIKDEMGMKGFWYLRGYIQAQRDIRFLVERKKEKRCQGED